MKRLLPLILALLGLMASCDRYAKYEALLYPIDSLSSVRPDSALRLLGTIRPRLENAPERIKVYCDLVKIKCLFNSGARFNSDSVIRKVADYYERHGTDNHRMLSKLMLGCVNRRMGNTAEALRCLEAAAASADTTAQDCEYKILGLTYGLLTDLYLEGLMPRNAINASRLCYRYAMKGGDTLTALSGLDLSANAYLYLSKPDSAIVITQRSSRLFRENGFMEASAISQAKLIETYLDRKDLPNAARCMATFDKDAHVIDAHGNANPAYLGIYYVKAIYAVYTDQLDSAAYWLGKLRGRKDLSLPMKEAMAYGLWQMYAKMGKTDSIIKYANMSYDLVDSITTRMMETSCSAVQAQYESARLQEQVSDKSLEAERMKTTALGVALVLLAVVLAARYAVKKKQDEIKRQERVHEESMRTLAKEQTDLQQLLTFTEEERDALVKEKREVIERLQRMEALRNNVDETTVEERLASSEIACRFRHMADNPTQQPALEDWQSLRSMLNKEVPGFYATLNDGHVLSVKEYNLCMLIRLRFKPLEISNLSGISQKSVSAMRRRLLQKVVGHDGKPSEFDDFIMRIKR